MAKSKGDQANRQKRQWYVASKSDGRAYKVVHDDPIRLGDIHAEKEAAYV
ncbi:MAG TPA: hypothetical protein VGA01_20760 [Candidatus Binatia bacterium]